MKNRISLLALLLGLANPACFALDLPVGLFQTDQTYGDFNGSIYHDGIDLPSGSTKTIISPISSGTVVDTYPWSANAGWVCVRDLNTSKIWVFGHIDPNPLLITNAFIDATTILGVLQPFPSLNSTYRYDHLHIALTINEKKCNRTGSEDPLSYFSPVTQSLTLNTTDIILVPDQFTAATAALLESKFPEAVGVKGVYGDVDLIVHGRNNVNGGNRSGVYQIDWQIGLHKRHGFSFQQAFFDARINESKQRYS